MGNDENSNDYKLLDYRLGQLEAGLKTVQDTLHAISGQLTMLSPLQGRVEVLEKEVDGMEKTIVDLQNMPYRRDSQRWEKVIGWVVQGITLACLAVILAKVGLA